MEKYYKIIKLATSPHGERLKYMFNFKRFYVTTDFSPIVYQFFN